MRVDLLGVLLLEAEEDLHGDEAALGGAELQVRIDGDLSSILWARSGERCRDGEGERTHLVDVCRDRLAGDDVLGDAVLGVMH